MAQFSVHRNKNPRTKAAFPFVVDVQSELLEPLNTRVVIPMTKAPALTKKPV
ncbi:MAG: CcdB protein, partial [Gammaproteobacteria bacterium]|nr:CcdB protein [Gammaproteobacteria bacterium]